LIPNNSITFNFDSLNIFSLAAPSIKDEIALKKNNTIQWHENHDVIFLECPFSDGFPKSEVAWFHNSEPITENFDLQIFKKTLNINRFVETLNGIYICNAKNEYGSVKYKFRLYLASNLTSYFSFKSYYL